ncbi:8984_t:CDS:2, partial [Racocetra persica]
IAGGLGLVEGGGSPLLSAYGEVEQKLQYHVVDGAIKYECQDWS